MSELTDRPYADELMFERWAHEEGYFLAVQVAYQAAQLAVSLERRPRRATFFCLHRAGQVAIGAASCPVAGYRLEDVLNHAFRATPIVAAMSP